MFIDILLEKAFDDLHNGKLSEVVSATRAVNGALEIIKAQAAQIAALQHDVLEVAILRMDLNHLRLEHQTELNSLKSQVAELQAWQRQEQEFRDWGV